MPKRFLVTAGLPYSNGRLHVGHISGAYLPADTFVRYLRACGQEVLYVCGSDDNGVAIEISSLQQQTTPQAVSTFYHQSQKADFERLRIDFDVYGGTHQPGFVETHEPLSQEFFRRIYDKGFFSKRSAKQLYDPKVERFLPDRYVKGVCHHCGDHETFGDQCDRTGAIIDPLLLKNPLSVITGQPAIVRDTTHWYLRLNEFEAPLKQWLESKQGHWRAGVLNFALGQIKQGLPERAMTRDIQWGIRVPLEDTDARGKVLFVWFDAPIGYISFTETLCVGRGDTYQRWWNDPECEIYHFIGEDNTVFHSLIWPAMLMADGRFQLPTEVIANNFVNYRVGGEELKISKSKTAADSPVWIEEFLKRFDPDALRYYLTAIAPESSRTAFDSRDFVQRNNAELVGALGNFVNRSLTFAANYFEGRVPARAAVTAVDRDHLGHAAAALRSVGQLISAKRFRAALEEMMAFARQCNQYFGVREPWKSRKQNLDDCAAAIATSIDSIQWLAILAYPFMPGAAQRILDMLNAPASAIRWQPPIPLSTGHKLGQPAILFGKLEETALE